MLRTHFVSQAQMPNFRRRFACIILAVLFTLINLRLISSNNPPQYEFLSPFIRGWSVNPRFQGCREKGKCFTTTFTKYVTDAVTHTERILQHHTVFVGENDRCPTTKTEVIYVTHTEVKLFSVTEFIPTRVCNRRKRSLHPPQSHGSLLTITPLVETVTNSKK